MIIVKKQIESSKVQEIVNVLEYLNLNYSIYNEKEIKHAKSLNQKYSVNKTMLEVKINESDFL